MNPKTRPLLAALLLLSSITARAADAPPAFDVWPGNPPGETKPTATEKVDVINGVPGPIHLLTNVSRPTLTVYRPPHDKDTGASVIICPGGGYAVLAMDLEGTEVADWLNSIGVTGIVLTYRVPQRADDPKHQLPLADAQRAVSLVRSKAKELNLDPNRIGLLGFSAGGHLTASAMTNFDRRAYAPLDDADKQTCRPDFAVLIYPAWLSQDKPDKQNELSPEIRVGPKTPPTFLAQAGDDPLKPDGCVLTYLALRRAGVAAELHIYPTGGHGFGLRPSNHPASTWPQRCEAWMRDRGLLRPAVR